jgi:SET domain-containing protein
MPAPKTWTAAQFEVRSSTIPGAGRGLFSRITIEPEQTIGYYTGEVLTADELYHSSAARSDYLLWLCRTHILIGEGPRANYTRYINHSSNPNLFLVVSTRWKTARFEALRPILPGEELFFNYGDDYWD